MDKSAPNQTRREWRPARIITSMYGVIIARQDNPYRPKPPTDLEPIKQTMSNLVGESGFDPNPRQEWFMSADNQVVFYIVRDQRR
jgi:hypothetical protein